AKSKWASAPNVWNQHNYSPLLINPDLSVPQKISSQIVDFGQTSCSNFQNVLYYNGGVIQVPYIDNEDFCPVNLSPEVYVVDGEIIKNGNDVSFKITYGNNGNAVALAKTPIRYYRNGMTTDNIIGNDTLGIDLFPGDTHSVIKTINISSYNPIPEQFYVRILDDGTNFPALGPFSDCNLTNNHKSAGTMEMSKTVNVSHTCTNSSTIFTVGLVNNTNQTKYNIVYVDNLSAGWDFDTASSSLGQVSAYNSIDQTIKWTIDSLEHGDSAVWHIITKTQTEGILRNYAWIESISTVSVGREVIEAQVTVNSIFAQESATLTPQTSFICDGDSVLLTADFEGAELYAWYLNYAQVATTSVENYWAKDTGHYTMMFFDGNCFSQLSNIVTVKSPDTLFGGTIGHSQSIIMGFPPNEIFSIIPVSGGWGTYAYQWQKKEENGEWVNIDQATNSDYSPEIPTAFLTAYRRIVTTSCDTAFSNIVTVQAHNYPDNIIEADCYVEPQPTEWSIRLYKEYDTVHTIQSPLVGDLDGDGYPDIFLKGVVTNASIYQDFIILRGPDFDTPVRHVTERLTSSSEAIARIKWDQTTDTSIIVVMTFSHYLKAYNIHGDLLWTSNTKIFNPTYATVIVGRGIGFADFNNDGYAEVYVGNQIFDAKTGLELCNGGTNNKGLTLYSNQGNGIFSIAMNIIGDQKLELCAGNQVYEVIINDRTNPALNSMTVSKQVTPQYNTTNLPNDGATVVSDFDNDGELEILVQTQAHSTITNSFGYLYIWKPSTEQILVVHQLTNAVSRNVPFVGDINGDGKVEIVVLTTNGSTRLMRAFVLSNNALNRLWSLNHTDVSGSTGLTLFDFNQDGIAEIVYRDETALRIINGSLKSHLTGADTNIVYNLYSTPAYSGTQYEYPVVADVDGDGHAEILTTSATDAADRSNNHNAKLYIYKGHADHPWAPARKVWNQYMYNAANINEDLTVPSVPLNPTTVFPGNDGIMNTGDEVQPYNNFLQQQTVLSAGGTSLWLTPDISFYEVNNSCFNYYADGDSLVAVMKIVNGGDAAVSAPLYLSVYRNEVALANRIATDSTMQVIMVKDTMLMSFTVRNLSTYFSSMTDIIVRINDRGEADYVQLECKTDNNTA
ncbi:MAG: FG-GAP-like repeat-containing protein, partial [Bacteroidales bacterium]|nr:FG-GAP-like repeat-containing protein [Bacteroidales bacterium]